MVDTAVILGTHGVLKGVQATCNPVFVDSIDCLKDHVRINFVILFNLGN